MSFPIDVPPIVPLSVSTLAVMIGLRRRVLRHHRYFQQEEYDGKRFIAWYKQNRAWDTRLSLVCLLGVIMFAIVGAVSRSALAARWEWWLIAGLFVMVPNLEADPTKTGKITLKLTARAKRIWHVATLLQSMIVLAFGVVCYLIWPALAGRVNAGALFFGGVVLVVQLSPFMLPVATKLLAPGEQRRQQGFIAEAKTKLADVSPAVVGITGSYGKTSTKTILASFLETIGPTFWPPRSINTEMGIVRELRERLQPSHAFAIIEMGAYRKGSIAKLCALTPPRVAIVTYVGVMHLERFGSPEAVYEAKSELPQALPPDGLLICNGDNEGARRMTEQYPSGTNLLYGFDSDGLDARMSDIAMTPDGSTFTIHWKGEAYEGSTPLLGKPMLSNLLASFTAACALGAHPAAVVAQARHVKPAEHRLELKRRNFATGVDGSQPGAEVVMLDDSYNSNPVGFAQALEVLAMMPAGRRWLVTPGMIELGEMQADENTRLARLAADVCDRVVVIGDTNAPALRAGLEHMDGHDTRVSYVADRDAAIALLAGEAQADDVVLWENDLPDVYEDVVRF